MTECCLDARHHLLISFHKRGQRITGAVHILVVETTTYAQIKSAMLLVSNVLSNYKLVYKRARVNEHRCILIGRVQLRQRNANLVLSGSAAAGCT